MAAPESALNELADLGSALANSAGNAGEQAKVKDKILDMIATLDQDTAKSLFKNEKVQRLVEIITDERAQTAQDPPGTIRDGWIGSTKVNGFTKKEWTEADLRNQREGAGKWVTFTPVETLPVFWNGLMRQFIADEEITVEKCFKDIYDQHRLATRQGREHAAYLFKQRNTLSDPSMVSAEGARARGTGETGWYIPGGGSIITATPTAPAAAESEAQTQAQAAEGNA